MADVAPTVLPTIRAGEEVLIGARITGDVTGDVIVRGSVAGQAFEQHYPVKLAVSTAAGNAFVPGSGHRSRSISSSATASTTTAPGSSGCRRATA